MQKEERNMLNYIVVCISEFASRYEMHMRDAYLYLKENKGIEFLRDFYDVEHTLSFDDVIEDLTVICRKNESITMNNVMGDENYGRLRRNVLSVSTEVL